MTSSKTQPEISYGYKKRFLVDNECYEAEGFRNSTFKRAIGVVPMFLSQIATRNQTKIAEPRK